MEDYLLLSFILLGSGIAIVPIAVWLGLGSVLGFLIAGMLLGPALTALNVDVDSMEQFAEFGVVMMLFLIGLELAPKKLWDLRRRLLGLGGLQLLCTTLAIMGPVMAFGQQWQVALTIGLIFSLSSTAIVLQTLHEKGLLMGSGGQSSFSVLLMQDIAVIPILALLPLLALPDLAAMGGSSVSHGPTTSTGHLLNLVLGLPGWLRALVTLGSIILVIVGGSYLIGPVFRYVESAKLPELFTAMALTIIVGVAVLMMAVGLTPALGAFIAGVVLANSEYRNALEKEITPFKGLFLGLFFVSVGASVNFRLMVDHIGLVVSLTLGVMIIKALVLFVLGRLFGVSGASNWLFALGMAQAGEFGFVLLSFSVATHVLSADLANTLIIVVALSMVLTPLSFLFYDKVIAPRYVSSQPSES
ncbi:cation:proton antiporter [Ruegeria sp. Ofav3-42]|uniref:cation:proton antiporter domain-containing protein n=1 Tax=Ruegeria sp. Ofav3-42 TaxID=2917759 RepID=UPI001EF3FDE1|nr:cation:proton antiporter [Ruegeria sp. Ofav3-42]MCG7522310.1 cation:proton antiporter [Ruegeria sp. Ofav3-42]